MKIFIDLRSGLIIHAVEGKGKETMMSLLQTLLAF